MQNDTIQVNVTLQKDVRQKRFVVKTYLTHDSNDVCVAATQQCRWLSSMIAWREVE
jgi:hypothetical protein